MRRRPSRSVRAIRSACATIARIWTFYHCFLEIPCSESAQNSGKSPFSVLVVSAEIIRTNLTCCAMGCFDRCHYLPLDLRESGYIICRVQVFHLVQHSFIVCVVRHVLTGVVCFSPFPRNGGRVAVNVLLIYYFYQASLNPLHEPCTLAHTFSVHHGVPT